MQSWVRSVAGMTLSFVIPAFKEERYLPGCLGSILRETANLATPSISSSSTTPAGTAPARSPSPSPAFASVDEPRKGLPYARQAGFVASSGDLIANIDADSLLPSGWIDTALRHFHADPDLAALSGPLVYHELKRSEDLMVRVFYATTWLTYVVNRHVLRVGSMVQGGNFIVRRSALRSIGGFNLGIAFYGEDTDIARRLHKIGNVLFTFQLKMPSSARRLRKEGIYRMAVRYSVNYLRTTFLKRPYTEEYLDIREGGEVCLREIAAPEAAATPELPSWGTEV